MKSKVVEIFERNGIFIEESEVENLGNAIAETLEEIADKIEREEPHAHNSFGRYRDVARDITEEITKEETEEQE